MLEIIGITSVVLVAAPLVYAATWPDRFRVERTATIKLRPKRIFPLLGDFHKGEDWSPTSVKGGRYEKDHPMPVVRQ